MGKRLLSCLLFFAMIITLSACSNQEEEQKAVQEVVQSYLTDCKNGDYKEADALLSEDADVSMNLTAFYEQLDDQLVNMDLGEDFDKEARKFVSAFMNKTFDQYKIDSTQIDNKEATALITLKGKDSEAFDVNSLQTELMNSVQTYMEENAESLEAYATEHTQEELEAKLYKDLSALVFGNMTKSLEDLPDTETNLKFTLKQEDGQWKINNIENTNEKH
ncbi:hypothetical protein [Dubosiella newyorkensis]|uniref:DUF5105 domain-containing protein n=3 Tax=Dubosiella newyorkensis TaxID=1862672 RepID=A0A1U7NQP1_9FIRM|nr:hypothetical protein [Dubosiella newyorkensis]OLU47949.1 hypothetical protein BO225_00515 [Dubosiella newyorkensis]